MVAIYCVKCGECKARKFFYESQLKEGYNLCILCCKEKSKNTYYKNIEQIKQRKKDYYFRNREKLKAYQRRYKQEKKDAKRKSEMDARGSKTPRRTQGNVKGEEG